MIIDICYNEVVEFDPIKFRDFVRNKFVKWRGSGRESLGDYAQYIGVSSQVMSNWYNGKLKDRPETVTFLLLFDKYEDEVYDALCLNRSKLVGNFQNLPPNFRRILNRITAEVSLEMERRGLTSEMPQAETLTIEIFDRYGFKYTSTTISSE